MIPHALGTPYSCGGASGPYTILTMTRRDAATPTDANDVQKPATLVAIYSCLRACCPSYVGVKLGMWHSQIQSCLQALISICTHTFFPCLSVLGRRCASKAKLMPVPSQGGPTCMPLQICKLRPSGNTRSPVPGRQGKDQTRAGWAATVAGTAL